MLDLNPPTPSIRRAHIAAAVDDLLSLTAIQPLYPAPPDAHEKTYLASRNL